MIVSSTPLAGKYRHSYLSSLLTERAAVLSIVKHLPAIIALIGTFLAFATGAQLFIGENAGMVSIFPDGCQAIASDWFDIHQRCLFNGQACLILQHSRLTAFACAPGTGTGPAQC